MKLLDPQPMETLPEKGWVFVEWERGTEQRDVAWIVAIGFNLFRAWSYTATTKGDEDGDTN